MSTCTCTFTDTWRGRRVVGFFLISHGFTWAFWLAAVAAAGANVWASHARWFVYVGGLGPLIAGVVMTWRTAGRAGLRELGARIVDPRRIPRVWLAAALLLPPLAMAVPVALAAAAGVLHEAVDARELDLLLRDPAALLLFAAFVFVFGPLPEEIGWRGYALDALQQRWSALASSLLLGAAWALWHAPLFFIAGYYGTGGPPDVLLFVVAIIVHSVVYTWIYNNTNRSVLAAILFHFMINFTGMLVTGAAWVEWSRTGVTAVVAAAAVVAAGAATLRHEPLSRRNVTG
jgi:uncharacterized protein